MRLRRHVDTRASWRGQVELCKLELAIHAALLQSGENESRPMLEQDEDETMSPLLLSTTPHSLPARAS